MADMMDNVHRYFATTVGLITTKGKQGSNVMSAEWTMQISYDPMLIAIFIHNSPTYWNIEHSRAFGVNIASDDQSELVNIAGGYSGTEIDKLAIPDAFQTYPAKRTDVPMIMGCALNAECKVVSMQKMGDHIMVVGEALDAKFDEEKFPLIYTRGNYRKMSRSKIPSGRRSVKITPAQMARLKEMSGGQFVLKAAVASIRHDGKTLLEKFGGGWAAPMVAVKRGANYKDALQQHLQSIGISAEVDAMARIERMMLASGKAQLRANFIVFDCTFKSLEGSSASWFARPPKNAVLKRLIA
jgi:flavin reductase (DIM6/NTAB) family NADH-FMN oxidoreductase RutF